MDKDRLKKICELALESEDVIISEFNVIQTQKLDEEKNVWVPNSYALFLTLKRKIKPELITTEDNIHNFRNVENFLESLLGFECCVDFI